MRKFALSLCVFSVVLGAIGCSGSSNAPVLPVAAADQTALQVFRSMQASGTLPTLDVTTSVTGSDSDSNGVRDDIDKYIASLSDTAVQKKALTQLAKAIQTTLSVDTTSASALSAASLQLQRGDACVWQVYPKGQSAKALTLEEFTVNTLPRLMAYEKYNSARNGSTVSGVTGTVCN